MSGERMPRIYGAIVPISLRSDEKVNELRQFLNAMSKELGFGYDYCEFRMDWFDWLETYSRPIKAAFDSWRKRKGKAA